MMRLTRLFCCLALLTAITGCGASMANNSKSPEKKPFVGTWKGVDPFGQTMLFTLQEDGRLTLKVTSRKRSFTKQGTYKIDTSKDPAHFDIKLTDRSEIKTILKVIDDDQIAFESINSSDNRPRKLGDRRIVLKRQ